MVEKKHGKRVEDPSLYRQTHSTFEALVKSIEAGHWRQAQQDLTAFHQVVSVRLAKTGRNANLVHEAFRTLELKLPETEVFPGIPWPFYFKRISCRNALNKLVKNLWMFGIYIGQQISWETIPQELIPLLLERYPKKVTTLALGFTTEEVSKEEIHEEFLHLRQMVVRLSFDDRDMILIQHQLCKKISEAISILIAMDQKNPGAKNLQAFATAFSDLEQWITNFLQAQNNPNLRNELVHSLRNENTSD